MLDVANMVVVGTAHISSLKIRPKRRRYLQDQLTLAAGRGLGSDWHVESRAAAVQTQFVRKMESNVSAFVSEPSL